MDAPLPARLATTQADSLIMRRRLFAFPGGLSLAEHEEAFIAMPVIRAPIPERLVFPLQQHTGEPAEPVVQAGDRVLKGQLIAKASGDISAAVHASSSGIVTAIADYPVAHASGLNSRCIEVTTDKLDQWISPRGCRNKKYRQTPPAETIKIIHDAGIIGMGGAGFPSSIKLDAGKRNTIDTLILNGAECEPHVSCDDMLMRERPDEILSGALVMMHALQASHCIIALEDNKPEAYNTLLTALKNDNLSDHIILSKVPTIFPAGGEKQLIKLLTNKEIAMRDLPIHYGIVVHNVATAAAVHRAVIEGEPLISRYLTVTGALPESRNLEVLIGTPVVDLLKTCGAQLQSLNKIIMGGPMMGIALHSSSTPVIKTTFCIIAQTHKAIPAYAKQHAPLPCIRCGDCADVCPARLLPQQLYWHSFAEEFERAESYDLFDCIECGCCDYVCPSHIPLVQLFRFAKLEIKSQQQQKSMSDAARQRYENRLQRLDRDKQEKAARHRIKVDALSQKLPTMNLTEEKKGAIQTATECVQKKNKENLSQKNQ